MFDEFYELNLLSVIVVSVKVYRFFTNLGLSELIGVDLLYFYAGQFELTVALGEPLVIDLIEGSHILKNVGSLLEPEHKKKEKDNCNRCNRKDEQLVKQNKMLSYINLFVLNELSKRA